LDVRFPTHAEMAKVEQASRARSSRRPFDRGHERKLVIERSTFLPLEPAEPHDRLFAHYAAARRGARPFDVQAEYTGGSADSGFTSRDRRPRPCAAPAPAAKMLHQPDEVCHIDSLVPRAQAVALAILRLAA
jgi:glutamate carboxypeptidase